MADTRETNAMNGCEMDPCELQGNLLEELGRSLAKLVRTNIPSMGDLESVHRKIRDTSHRLDLIRVEVQTHGNDIREISKEFHGAKASACLDLEAMRARLRDLEGRPSAPSPSLGEIRAEREGVRQWLCAPTSPPATSQVRSAIRRMLRRDRIHAEASTEDATDIGY